MPSRNNGYRVLSVCDGIGIGRYALEALGIPIEVYFASEIKGLPMDIHRAHYPTTKFIGDIHEVTADKVGKIDLLIGGTPCQGFSRIGKALNFEDPRSKLFFEFVRLKNELSPRYFFLENVNMNKEWVDIINEELGVEAIKFNSNRVSAQFRDRLYWTNLPVAALPDSISPLKVLDVKDSDALKHYPELLMGDKVLARLTPKRAYRSKQIHCIGIVPESVKPKGNYLPRERVLSPSGKARCLTTILSMHPYYRIDNNYRRLSPLEMERLQTLPDGYTRYAKTKRGEIYDVKLSDRVFVLGDAWTGEAIKEFFKSLKQ